MKKYNSFLSRGAAGLMIPLILSACGRGGGNTLSERAERQIDSVENLRRADMHRLDSCIMRADMALNVYGEYADKMDAEYKKMIDSKYLLSKYYEPGALDHIRDTADNWMTDAAHNTDEYKRLQIDQATLMDLQSLFSYFSDRIDIDVCVKELMGVLEFNPRTDGRGYDVKFADEHINLQFQRQRADYVNIGAYRDSRRQMSDAVRAIADSAAVIRGRVADYDAQLVKLRNRAKKMQR